MSTIYPFNSHFHYIVIIEQPEAMALDDGDVMASVGATATVNHDCYQVIHVVCILSIIGLGEGDCDLTTEEIVTRYLLC